MIGTGPEVKSTPLITFLCVSLIVFTAVLALLPMTRGRITVERVDTDIALPKIGIGAQFVTFFLSILGIVLIMFFISILRILYVDFTAMTGEGGNVSVVWLRTIILVAIAGTFFMATLPLLLKIIQQKVINPVLAVSAYTRKFVSEDKLEQGRLVVEHTGNELDDLSESVNTMVDKLRSFIEDIRKRTEKEEKLAAELNIAKNIQRGLLPGNWEGTGFEIVPYIKPAKEVGGDFYYFSALDEDRVFICIADVSGKDISAAMFMVETKTLIEANCTLPPEQMLARVNDILSKTNPAMMFVTAFTAVVDRKNRRMTYANAGHNPPICRNAGEVKWLDGEADFVLGPMEGTQYQRHTMEIADDFELFIYTDGVNEAENLEKEFYGNDRLFQQMNITMNESPSCSELIKTMEQSLEAFTEGADPSDDITMLALAVK
ncbi:PP2C family protein-serine/threonine phosphatase [Eubacterium sp. 1001713B170207_170306_E7]|uniref:SpoIIE family protein phosphatase n=1 Tax=Eubacterium sp. 1001713B170207_170306_E7 TaxID=2787097 RepID=UPI00189C48D5